MIHFLNLFLLDTVKYLAVLVWGLFSIIFIIENGAVLNADIIEKYQVRIDLKNVLSFNHLFI